MAYGASTRSRIALAAGARSLRKLWEVFLIISAVSQGRSNAWALHPQHLSQQTFPAALGVALPCQNENSPLLR